MKHQKLTIYFNIKKFIKKKIIFQNENKLKKKNN
jgi:hypothetical protein